MKNFNAFRPTLNAMEERSLMSASFAAPPAEPVGYVITLSDALISSATPGATDASPGQGAGKPSFSDLSAVPTEAAQTREHILLARQVGVPVSEEASKYDHKLGGGSFVIDVEPTAAAYMKYDGLKAR